MKNKNLFFLLILVSTLCIGFSSCNDDDKGDDDYLNLTLEKSSILLKESEKGLISIVSGNGNYQFTSANANIATAILDTDGMIEISALAIGKTTINVLDRNGNVAPISVTVISDVIVPETLNIIGAGANLKKATMSITFVDTTKAKLTLKNAIINKPEVTVDAIYSKKDNTYTFTGVALDDAEFERTITIDGTLTDGVFDANVVVKSTSPIVGQWGLKLYETLINGYQQGTIADVQIKITGLDSAEDDESFTEGFSSLVGQILLGKVDVVNANFMNNGVLDINFRERPVGTIYTDPYTPSTEPIQNVTSIIGSEFQYYTKKGEDNKIYIGIQKNENYDAIINVILGMIPAGIEITDDGNFLIVPLLMDINDSHVDFSVDETTIKPLLGLLTEDVINTFITDPMGQMIVNSIIQQLNNAKTISVGLGFDKNKN